jgi:hypothetical protein
MGDNQRNRGVVIATTCSLGALDHQRRDLHPIKLSYLTEDRATLVVDGILEDAIPEALWCELLEINAIDVDIVRSDEVSPTSLLVGPEVSLSVPQGVLALAGHTTNLVLTL